MTEISTFDQLTEYLTSTELSDENICRLVSATMQVYISAPIPKNLIELLTAYYDKWQDCDNEKPLFLT